MVMEHIAKGKPKQTLHHDLTDNEASEAEYIAMGEDKNIKAQHALFHNTNQGKGGELDTEQEEGGAFIKEEEVKPNQLVDVMDVDQLSETREASKGTEYDAAMDIKNLVEHTSVTGNTNAENDTKDNIRIIVHQNENEGGCDICHMTESAGINKLPSILFHGETLQDQIQLCKDHYEAMFRLVTVDRQEITVMATDSLNRAAEMIRNTLDHIQPTKRSQLQSIIIVEQEAKAAMEMQQLIACYDDGLLDSGRARLNEERMLYLLHSASG
ncbi:hypothetical protein PS15m_005701 [Mucor circinelloides]